ncbi:MAG: signal peptidase I [Clostridium sp.]|jgi:signal peptidase I|nr:signal peptidase I [Clostridium sp.]
MNAGQESLADGLCDIFFSVTGARPSSGTVWFRRPMPGARLWEGNMTRDKGLNFYKRRKRISTTVLKEVFSWIFGIGAAVFSAVVLNYFLGMSISVVGVSMEPTLYNGQRVFVNRFLYTLSDPKEGDVIVFLPNGNQNAHYYVKRVAALPGDRVLIRDGVLYVNSEASEWITVRITEPGIAESELTLKNGEYFCIGDNPVSSEDSRSANIGPVQAKDIIGKVWFCLKHEEGSMGLVK